MRYGPYEIQLTVRANCKRLRLVYHPSDHRLTMSAPPTATQKQIDDFLYRNRQWIDERMNSQSVWLPSFVPGERHLLFGQYVTLGKDAPCGEANLERYRTEALKTVLRLLLEKWTKRMGVHVQRVTIRETRSRWGSCRKDTAALSFSLRLARVPEDCVEQVVVHELCHLIHANHSPAFYALLESYLPDWKERCEQLNRFDIRPLPSER